MPINRESPCWDDEGAQMRAEKAALALLRKAGLRSASKTDFAPNTPEARAIAALARAGLTSRVKEALK